MKKISIGFVLLLIFLSLVACTKPDLIKYVYVGESEHWQGHFEVISNNSEMYEYKLEIQYKEDIKDLNELKEISFEYNNLSQKGQETVEYKSGEDPKKGIYISTWHSSGTPIQEDTVTTVIVKWGDFEEKMELRKE